MDTFYPDVDDAQLSDDIARRKEFAELKIEAPSADAESAIIPYYMLRREMAKGRFLRYKSYQLFVANFLNPDTPWTRLLANHAMGSGKTLTAIGVAMRFIERLRTQESVGWVYVIGFTRAQFERDLFKWPELGFITRQEQEQREKLRQRAASGTEADVKAYKDYWNYLRRRLGSGRGNGFFRFIGYRELANRIFKGALTMTPMNEAEIIKALESGSLVADAAYVEQFRNSLIICDEVHNLYNSVAKNNEGVAVQMILNILGPSVRALFLSGTILKNSHMELTDLLNLLAGTSAHMFRRADFFSPNGELKPGALAQVTTIVHGRVSFLVDVNPRLYPSFDWRGTQIEGIPYFRFERCVMSAQQLKAYARVAADSLVINEHHYIFDMVYPNPDPVGDPIFMANKLRMIESASPTWRTKVGVSVNIKEKAIAGSILERERLGEWSGKYLRMLELLDAIHATSGGKVFVYHEYVHMTGVYQIGHVLSANGYVALGVQPGERTRCALCAELAAEHPKVGHEFSAACFVIVHGDMDKRALVAMIDKYNASDNTDGRHIMIIVGSRVLREAYDLLATRAVFVMSRPDNIPALLQITARAIRDGSHRDLPAERQHVDIHVFTAATPDHTSSPSTYEEERYGLKVASYIIIQQIERTIHAAAIDADINRSVIAPSLVTNGVGHLTFDAPETTSGPMTAATFKLFYREREVADTIYIIKRLFMEHSKVWQHDDLWAAVRAPPFAFEYNAALIAPESFAIAIHRLVWRDDYFGEESSVEDQLTSLANPANKQIILDGRTRAAIIAMADYYIAFALDPITQRPQVYADAPFRIAESMVAQTYSVASYARIALSRQHYIDLKAQFMTMYRGKPIGAMTDAICLHGQDFHTMLAEEVVAYVFDLWTNTKAVASAEYNAFYFQMLYFYDVMGLIVWLNSAHAFIRDMYADIDRLVRLDAPTSLEDLLPKNTVSTTRNRADLIELARAIEHTGCSWCPKMTSTRFDKALAASKMRFAKIKTATTDVPDDMIPIGHIVGDVARFFHPTRAWFSSPEYTARLGDWKENDIIIGFDTKSIGGLHVRFRLRNPRHKIKHHDDTRLIERGIICTSKSKEFLITLAKKIGLKSLPANATLVTMCREIRARLLWLELMERAKGSRIKWFYNQFEPAANVE